jgi:hypothetical protein
MRAEELQKPSKPGGRMASVAMVIRRCMGSTKKRSNHRWSNGSGGGFRCIVLVPGHGPLWPGLVAPIFWIAGLILSSVALSQNS